MYGLWRGCDERSHERSGPIGHAKQRIRTGRYLGITEPTIIAAESPNPIVNELVIMPDMEKRLEAFVRLAHAIVVYFREASVRQRKSLYILGILLSPRNESMQLPLIFTGPRSSEAYFLPPPRIYRRYLGAGRTVSLPSHHR